MRPEEIFGRQILGDTEFSPSFIALDMDSEYINFWVIMHLARIKKLPDVMVVECRTSRCEVLLKKLGYNTAHLENNKKKEAVQEYAKRLEKGTDHKDMQDVRSSIEKKMNVVSLFKKSMGLQEDVQVALEKSIAWQLQLEDEIYGERK